MKNKNSFIFKGLISLMLSLVMICGTAVTSLSAVTDQVVAAVKEPVRSAIPDAPAPAQAADQTDIATQSDSSVADYGVAEGSMFEAPADDDVLDISLDDNTLAAASSAPLGLSSKKDTELAATGALTASEYYIGSQNSNYKLVKVNNQWQIKEGDNYIVVSHNGRSYEIESSSTSGTVWTVNANNSLVATVFNNDVSSDPRSAKQCYVSYNGSSIICNESSKTVQLYAASPEPATEPSTEPATEPSTEPATEPSTEPDTSSNTKTLYFTNNAGWQNVYAYLWKDDTKNADYPGVQLKKLGINDFGEDIYSVTFNADVYESVIFNSGSNGSQTVDISISETLQNGSGVFCKRNGDEFVYTDGKHEVDYYLHGIDYSKQIEKLSGEGHGDYDYRVHLTLDGRNLVGTSTETQQNKKKQRVALIIDATETMTSTSLSGSPSGENKFQTIQRILKQDGGFLEKYLDGNNEVAVLFIGGVAGNMVSYTEFYKPALTKTTDINAARGNWSEFHFSQPISYTTALLAAEDIFDPQHTQSDDYSVVFIAGNAPGTYVNINTKKSDNTVDSKVIPQKNVEDCESYLDSHPNVTFYGVGMASQSGDIEHGSKELKEISDYSGGYYGATDVNTLADDLLNIITDILPGDHTNKITLSDKLSSNVSVLGTNGNYTAVLNTKKVQKNAETEENKIVDVQTDVTAEVSYNTATGTFTFNHPDIIDGPFTVEITYDIRTADGVYQDTDTYGATGYPNTGDENTDYGENTTSSNKPGFNSNETATISYYLNSEKVNGTFKHPVVQAPEDTPVQGKYIFQYTDRFGDTQEVTVPVTLNSREKTGYSGNGGQAGVPTFLWTDDAKTLYNNINPLVKAALALEGNEEMGGDNWQKDASVYKCDLVWDNLTAISQGTNVSYNTTEHSVTIEATTTPYKFKLLYYTVNGSTATLQGTASELEYGKAVTFNPIYSGSSEYAYVEYTVPSNGFSYWSADPEGAIPITTNLTYGMIMRGDYMHDNDDDRTVHIYAQYNKTPEKLWNPLIEEAKLTHTIDDDHDWVYLDYMTNYLSKDGTVVQEMEVKPEYGIVVAKYDSTRETLSQETMQSVAKSMIEKDKSSAYLDKGKTAIAYRFKYNDNEHISDFNRTLYTLKSDTSEADNKRFTAIAYIVVDDVKYYSLINTDITVIDLV